MATLTQPSNVPLLPLLRALCDALTSGAGAGSALDDARARVLSGDDGRAWDAFLRRHGHLARRDGSAPEALVGRALALPPSSPVRIAAEVLASESGGPALFPLVVPADKARIQTLERAYVGGVRPRLLPDGRGLLTAWKHGVRLFDLERGALLWASPELDAAIVALAPHADGRRVIACTAGGLVTLDRTSGRVLAEERWTEGPLVGLDDDGAFAVAAEPSEGCNNQGEPETWYSALLLFQIEPRALVQRIPRLDAEYPSARVVGGGRWILTRSYRCAELLDREKIEGGSYAHVRRLASAALSPSGRRLLGGGALIDLAGGTERPLSLPDDAAVLAIDEEPRRAVLGVTYAATLSLWDLDGPQRLASLDDPPAIVASAQFLPGGRLLACAGSRIRVLDLEEAPGLVPSPLEHEGPVRALLPLGDGRRALTASEREIKLWDVERGALLFDHRAEVAIRGVTLLGSGTRAVTWDSTSRDPAVRAISLADGSVERVLPADVLGISLVVPLGTSDCVILRAAPSALLIWDTATGEVRSLGDLPSEGWSWMEPQAARFEDAQVLGNLTSFDGRLPDPGLVARSDGRLVATWNERWLPRACPVHFVPIDPDGKADGLASAVLVEGHGQRLCAMLFAADGRRVVTADTSGAVRVTDPASGASPLAEASLGGAPAEVRLLEGDRLLLRGDDGSCHLWALDGLRPLWAATPGAGSARGALPVKAGIVVDLDGGGVRVLDPRDGSVRTAIEVGREIRAVRPGGEADEILVIAEASLQLWSLSSGRRTAIWEAERTPSDARVLPCGGLIAGDAGGGVTLLRRPPRPASVSGGS